MCCWGRVLRGKEALFLLCIHKVKCVGVTKLGADRAALPSPSAEGLGQVPLFCRSLWTSGSVSMLQRGMQVAEPKYHLPQGGGERGLPEYISSSGVLCFTCQLGKLKFRFFVNFFTF